MPIQFGSIAKTISHEAKLASLPSPNLEAMTPSVNLALIGKITDGIANTEPVLKGTSKVLSCKAGTEALSSASHLRYKVKNKAPQRAKSEDTMTLLPKSPNAKFTPRGGATRLTSPIEVNTTNKVISESPKSISLKARGLQSKQPHTSLTNTDLRKFLTNKQKLEPFHTSPSCCDVSW